MPQISIIVPVYNVEKYLSRCLDSILAQTFRDFELILVDDGSTDTSGAICDEYTAQDRRIRVYHQKNQGPAASRNLGVQCAHGKYVTFIDADDFVPVNYLSFLVSGISKFDADICVVLESEFNNDQMASPIYHDDYTCFSSNEAIRYTFNRFDSTFRSPWAKLIRKSIVLEELFPADRSYSEDTATVYRWYNRAERIIINSSRLYYYMQNETSLVHVPFSYTRLGIFATYDELSRFFCANGFEDLYRSLVKIYIDVACSHYEQLKKELHDNKTAHCVRKKLKELLRSGKRVANISPSTASQCYNIVYPLRMYIYWTRRGVMSKIKGIFKRK